MLQLNWPSGLLPFRSALAANLKTASKVLLAASLVTLGGCLSMIKPNEQTLITETEKTRANQKSEQLFSQTWELWLNRSPMLRSRLGIKGAHNQWDNQTPTFRRQTIELEQAILMEAKSINLDALTSDNKLSLNLLIDTLEKNKQLYDNRHYQYPISQMGGLHTAVPTFLMNVQKIESLEDANDYIDRINGVRPLFNQLIDEMKERASHKIYAPKFVYPLVIDAAEKAIKGYPFEKSRKVNSVYQDFSDKVAKLDLYEESRKVLLKRARKALKQQYKRGYTRLIRELKKQQIHASENLGISQFEGGRNAYELFLASNTTTEMSASEIHQLGLNEVKRIHDEIKQVMATLKYEGTLKDFFKYTRDDPKFYFQNTEEGRKEFLEFNRQALKNIEKILPNAFNSFPKAKLVVKPVEPFREASSGLAFYNRPPLDGSRPGIYYANLSQLNTMPKYMLTALAYHEGLPGHHLQIAMAQELEQIPDFRKVLRYTAFTEGWALYSEYLAKEMGAYPTAYDDYGRLVMELRRALRLVLDTGLHAMGWTQEQAIQFSVDNSPLTEQGSKKSVQRFLVMPGQATAYKIGMNKIIDLKRKAKSKMGSKFSEGEFHQVVIGAGPMTLSELEKRVEEVFNL